MEKAAAPEIRAFHAALVPIPDMLRRQLEIPPEAAKAFVRDMKAFFKAKDQLARLHARQQQFGAQATARRAAQRQATAIERGQIDHDRQPKARSRL